MILTQEFCQIVVAAVVSNSVALAALGFLFKSFVGHLLDKDVSLYKSRLEMENLKLQISYGGIFEKQANVILDLYSRLLSLELGANPGSLATPDQWNHYREAIKSTVDFYHEQRVMLPQALDKKIQNTLDGAYDILTNSTDGRTPQEFAAKFREAKDSTLSEMRRLLSVGAQEG
jgi:hypothetical protein